MNARIQNPIINGWNSTITSTCKLISRQVPSTMVTWRYIAGIITNTYNYKCPKPRKRCCTIITTCALKALPTWKVTGLDYHSNMDWQPGFLVCKGHHYYQCLPLACCICAVHAAKTYFNWKFTGPQIDNIIRLDLSSHVHMGLAFYNVPRIEISLL